MVSLKYRLMDLLACPICKKFPLKLIVFNTVEIQPPKSIRRCELHCAFHEISLSKDSEPDCKACYSKEITDGIILCEECGRWYPIEEEIPRLLPDKLRRGSEEIAFLKKWKDKIPEHILKDGKPFSLKE